ncbi:MAG: hypothetical protein H5T74_14520 [Actinobacteria bacterium]|nr:hypothetical protein [Actinomycetota bacterium]
MSVESSSSDTSCHRVIDLSSESLGQRFVEITERQRMRYRIRRNLDIEVVNMSLCKYNFEFDLWFPGEFFIKAIAKYSRKDLSPTEREAIAYITGKNSGPFSIIVPVFITDMANPTSDFTVTDSDGRHLNVPNRFETSTIWGLLLNITFRGTCGYILGQDKTGHQDLDVTSARRVLHPLDRLQDKTGHQDLDVTLGSLRDYLDDEETAVSLIKVFSSLAWIAAADTSRRFQSFDVSPYAGRFECFKGIKNPSSLFYLGLPLDCCTEEQAAARLLCWALREVSVAEKDSLRDLPESGWDNIEIFNKIKEMVQMQQEIEIQTYKNRDTLRSILDNERYETVFEQTCPVTNPLLYIRAYVKRYLYAVRTGAVEAGPRTSLDLLDEYIDHSLAYLKVVHKLVMVIIGLAAKDDYGSRERARRGLNLINHLCIACNTWKVFAFVEIMPEERKKIKLTTYVHTHENSQYRERDEIIDQHIKNRIYISKDIQEKQGPLWWRGFYLKTRCLFIAFFAFLQMIRWIYHYLISFRMEPKRRSGFLYGARRASYGYRFSGVNCISIPYFFADDCQTQHLSLCLHGSDTEIQPSSTYVQTGERICGMRNFLKAPASFYSILSSWSSTVVI